MSATILDKIFEAKRARVAEAKVRLPVEGLRALAAERRAAARPGAFRSALDQDHGINIIAEVKRASPSKGLIDGKRDSVTVAKAYEQGGARAISVLTEEDFFLGSLSDLLSVREATALPLLRKDFIFDKYQVWEAAAYGADAILLIAAMVDKEKIAELTGLAVSIGLDVLVEVHSATELELIAPLQPKLIGVNNRDLHTFEVSLDVSRDLIVRAPECAVMIAESGLRSTAELEELRNLGYRGFLIGETLMRSDDPRQTLARLQDPNI